MTQNERDSMFDKLAAEQKTLQKLEEKYLDKEIENNGLDKDIQKQKAIPTYKEILKERKDLDKFYDIQGLDKILYYGGNQIQKDFTLKKERYMNNYYKICIHLVNEIESQVNNKLSPILQAHFIMLDGKFFIKNYSKFSDKKNNQIEKICEEILFHLKSIDNICDKIFYEVFSTNKDKYTYFPNTRRRPLEIWNGFYNIKNTLECINERNRKEISQIQTKLNKIPNYDELNVFYNTSAQQKEVQEKLLQLEKKISFAKELNSIAIEHIKNLQEPINSFKKILDDNIIDNNNDNNAIDNQQKYKLSDFALEKNDKIRNLLKQNPSLSEVLKQSQYEEDKPDNLINVILDNKELYKILSQSAFDSDKITLLIYLYLCLNPLKNINIINILVHFLKLPLITSQINFLRDNIDRLLKDMPKDMDVEQYVYAIFSKIKSITKIDKILELKGWDDYDLSRKYITHTFANNLQLENTQDDRQKVAFIMDILTNTSSDLKLVFGDERFVKNLYKFFAQNKNKLSLYLQNIPLILKNCIICYMCNKDISYIRNSLNKINAVSLENYQFFEVINSNESKGLFDSLLKKKGAFQESRVVSLLNNFFEIKKILHTLNNDKKQYAADYFIMTNITFKTENEKNFLIFNTQYDNLFDLLPESEIAERLNIINQNITDFKKSFNKYQEMFKTYKPINNNDNEFMKIYKFCQIINGLQDYVKYKSLQKPKINTLSVLNMEFPEDNIVFKVLGDSDYQFFTIGADTHCCQIIGGEGENAAIDSFINPVASVLILQTTQGKILAQSYFHYVQRENGFILDNVEINYNNIKKLNIKIHGEQADLTKYYKALADKLISEGFKYLKCGLAYNKLYPAQFKIIRNQKATDPRHFETDEYTDFSPNRYLLLSNNETKKEKTIINKKPKISKNRIEEDEWLSRQPTKFRQNFLHYRNKRDEKEQYASYLKENKDSKPLSHNLVDKLEKKYQKQP